jgi:hypothetical protein
MANEIYLGLVSIDGCIDVIRSSTLRRDTEDSHSKSPLSETTTVPVCLRRSRELDMMVVDKEAELF